MSSRLLSKSFVSIAQSQRGKCGFVARIHTQTPSAAMPALKEQIVQAANKYQKLKVAESANSPYFNTGKKVNNNGEVNYTKAKPCIT